MNTYVASIMQSAGDGTISLEQIVSKSESTIFVYACILMLADIAQEEDTFRNIPLNEDMSFEDFFDIVIKNKITVDNMWGEYEDFILTRYNTNPELQIRGFGENGHDNVMWETWGGQ